MSSNNIPAIEKLPSDDLRQILLTCDGQGRAVKQIALDQLIFRAKVEELRLIKAEFGIRD